jgi:hypothetical protein
MLIQEKQSIFPITEVNGTATANAEFNSVNVSNYNHAAFFLHFASTLVATGSSLTITLESGATDSADTKDVVFHYAMGTASAATLSTVTAYAADATASVLTYSSAGDYAGHTLIIQVDGDELQSTSLGATYNWLTVDLDNATAGGISAWCILSEPRYAGASMPVAV